LSRCTNNILSFRNKWNGVSGIYKITFLPFRLFTYYGSSSNLGLRFKYHYYNGPKQRNFLWFFLKTFGWTKFSITVIEVCSKDNLGVRENWYLSKYQPILNVLKSSGEDPRQPGIISWLTHSKISETLIGRKDSEITWAKKSKSRKGILNPFYGKGLGIKALDIAAEKAGTKIYVYDITSASPEPPSLPKPQALSAVPSLEKVGGGGWVQGWRGRRVV
jgi:group I intron endonuclease